MSLRQDCSSIAIISVSLATVLILACAEVAPPPGGEVDKVSPYLTESNPTNGETDVPIGNRIVLKFSERITEPTSDRAIFISPRQEKEPQIKWKSDHVLIELADSFKRDQTYIVSITSDVKDLRGNRLDSASTIAFSTGATIDSGHVGGIVMHGSAAKAGMLVALFDIDDAHDSSDYDSLQPLYLTQTNKSGQFSLDFLPRRTYRLLAFDDRNKDYLFDANREQFAVTDRPIDLDGDLFLDSLYLALTSRDTVAPAILSANFSMDQLLKVRFSKEIDVSLLKKDPSRVVLSSLEQPETILTARAILESNLDKAKLANFYMGEVDSGGYRLEITYDSSAAALVYDSLIIPSPDDRNPPTVARFEPSSTPRFMHDVSIQAAFSEPIDSSKLTDRTFTLWEDSTRMLGLSLSWQEPFLVMFTSADLRPGGSYLLKMTQFEISDLSGNLLGDSLQEYQFSILDSDSLGSVSGEIEVLLRERQSSACLLKFTGYGNGQVIELPVDGDKFRVELPAGKYALTGFVDSDGNGRRGVGGVLPFEYAETYAVHPDTIRVRARFETAGIKLVIR